MAFLYGFPPKAFTSRADIWRQSIHPADREALARKVAEGLASGTFEAEWRVIWPDGTVRWLAGRTVVYRDDSGRPQRMLGVNIDISDRKEMEQEMLRVAKHDPLTGLPNRELLFEFASHLLPAMRRWNYDAAFLFLDLDHFKPINDQYGHDVGDAVLKEVAHRMTASLRREDLVGRLGGDEFLAVLPNVHGEAGVSVIANHIIDRIAEPFLANGMELHVSPSIGISLFPRDGEGIVELIKEADWAMYAAKQIGRNNFQFFRTGLSQLRT